MVLNLIIAAVSLLVGGGVVLFVTKRMAHTRAKNIIEEAKLEADVLKKNKLLEVKEAELKMKADVEKQANSRMQKIQAAEANPSSANCSSTSNSRNFSASATRMKI